MLAFVFVGTLAALALVTVAGVRIIEQRHRPCGTMVDVAGGRLHVVDLGPRQPSSPPLVLLHGASSNLEAMRRPLGDLLARRHRVILIDRPGHGFSRRDDLGAGSPKDQAAMIDEALGRLGVARAIVVAHSWGGALGAALALDHAARVAGLVLLAPVTHPWHGGNAWYNALAVKPLLGTLFARTIALPLGLALMRSGARAVFLPQTMPVSYVRETAVALLFRPAEFIANAFDMVALKPAVAAMAPRYGEIAVPAVIVTGDIDTTVSPEVHARRFAAAVPGALLEWLPGVGHMPQNAAPERIAQLIDRLAEELAGQRNALPV